jgi:hypothetical protein
VRGRSAQRNTVGAVIGQVLLWGCVVESEHGWRASHAYPARLFVPLGRRGRLAFLSRRAADSARVAHALHAYRLPVELGRLQLGAGARLRARARARRSVSGEHSRDSLGDSDGELALIDAIKRLVAACDG